MSSTLVSVETPSILSVSSAQEASELQQNLERHLLSFHSPFIRFLSPFTTTDTTSLRLYYVWESAVLLCSLRVGVGRVI